MSKADNMLAILWLLKTGKRCTAKQLAEELEIHVRTVYRYIDALCASGVPIIADSGHNGGYSLPAHFGAAPLTFDPDEQKALAHAAVFAREAGYPFGDALNRAVHKLKLYASDEQRERLSRHARGVEVIHAPAAAAQADLLQQLEVATAEAETLCMDYQKGYGLVTEMRRIDPYGLVFWKNRWYVVGYCRLRSEVRSFRVDRIRALSGSGERFERPANFSAREFLLAGLQTDPAGAEYATVRVSGREQALNDLCSHWYFAQALAERKPTEALFRIERQSLFTMGASFLLAYGMAIRVEEPAELLERLATCAGELQRHYAGGLAPRA
ncbi:WYL domain-containing protein [Paenibacillus athensensis]|uniref:DNA-binding transcriptional regulator n=1 Tax=Paenibacillus athensensis TaxID=1967502 RepID=A0A4Y8PWE4_9BACL|nr:WYL domain-containing protein [Paenibacillus athensensis]MCD1260607.1 WYL domain-containing protein [Paenibacillus athensensis]